MDLSTRSFNISESFTSEMGPTQGGGGGGGETRAQAKGLESQRQERNTGGNSGLGTQVLSSVTGATQRTRQRRLPLTGTLLPQVGMSL